MSEVVVHVARSAEEAKRTRDAVRAAGLSIPLSDGEIEAAFAAGKPGVQLRVAEDDAEAAMQAIDAADPGPGPASSASPPQPAAADSAEGIDPRERKRLGRKLLWRAAKLLFINCFSLVIPAFGALPALFGLWGCLPLLRARVAKYSPEARYLAWLAFAVGLASFAWNMSLAWPYLSQGSPGPL